MKSVVRQQFLDLTWDAAHLDDAGKFWLQLYDIAAKWYGYSTTPQYRLKLRLWGFGRHQGESLASELERQAVVAKIGHPVVTLVHPDTLVLSSGEATAPTPPPGGLGLPLLAGSQFEGLAVQVRFRVAAPTKRVLGFTRSGYPSTIDVTLVINGEIRGGKLLVKAIWKRHAGFAEDEHYRLTPMAGELEFLGALEQFRRTGTVTRHELGGFFAPSVATTTRGQRLMWRILNVPFDRPRLLGLLIRFTIFGGLVAWSAWLWYRFSIERTKDLQGFAGLTSFIGGILLWKFLRTELPLLFRYWAFRRASITAHEESPSRVSYAVSPPDGASARTDDPAIRKYTADLAAEGFVFLGEVRQVPATATTESYRIFRARDGVTYIILRCYTHTQSDNPKTCNHVWPAAISFEGQTFFPDGGRVDSTAGWSTASQRQAVGPTTLVRTGPEMTDVLQFYLQHTAAVEAFANEKGLSPARHGRFEDYVRQQEIIHEEQWQYTEGHPYSWWDHLRWYLQWPRKEQRG